MDLEFFRQDSGPPLELKLCNAHSTCRKPAFDYATNALDKPLEAFGELGTFRQPSKTRPDADMS